MARRIRLKDKIELCLYWRYYVQCQLPLLDAIVSLAENHPHKGLQYILREVERALKDGDKLSFVLKRFPRVFDPVFVQLMYVAEQVGDYGLYLSYGEKYLRWRWQLTSLFFESLRYPLILGILVILLFCLVDYLLLPQLVHLFTSLGIATYPWPTRIFIMVMNGVPWFLIAGVGIFLLLMSWDRQRIPVLGPWIQKIYLMTFIQQLGILLYAKVDLLSALSVAIHGVPESSDYGQLEERIRNGYLLSKAMEVEKWKDKSLLRMVELGERTGKLGEVLMNYSQIELELLKQRMMGWVQLIQPLLVVFMGAMMAGFIAGVLGPLYHILTQHA